MRLRALTVGIAGFLRIVAAHAAAQTSSERVVLGAGDLTGVHSLVAGMTPQWSSDGSRLLFATSLGGSELWTVPVNGGFPAPCRSIWARSPFSKRINPCTPPTGSGYPISRTARDQRSSTPSPWSMDVRLTLTHLGARINSYSWSPDSRRIAFADDRFGNYDVYTVAIADGAVTRLTHDTRYEVFPAWTPDGRHVVYVRLDDRWLDHDVMVIDADGPTEARTVVSDTDFFDYAAGGGFGYPLVSPDGATILFKSQRSGWVNYWAVPLAGGPVRQVAPEAANQSGARWAPDGKSILYEALWNGTQDLRVVSAAGGTPRVLVKPAGMGVINNAAWSPDGARVSYTLESPVAAANLYVIGVAGGKQGAGPGAPIQLTESAGPTYVAPALIRPKKVTYPSADGFSIAAYLYEPILKPGERAPGVMLIHGGPTASWNDTYQVQAQYLAMHGYAVLLPNIRGSSGYGKQFEDANNGCWGRCDLKDVVAGVSYLRTLRYIDPTRMGITGTSYGGCMTLAAAAFAPGLFQAGIAQSGYGDWIQFYEEQEMRNIKLLNYELGRLPEAEALYKSISAVNYIDSIRTPLFLVHGEGKQLPRSVASRLFVDRLECTTSHFGRRLTPMRTTTSRARPTSARSATCRSTSTSI